MALTFKKATKAQSKARVALIGPAGSGKTYSALLIALTLGKRVAVIDTEHGSASKYAGTTDPATGTRLDFDVLELDSFSPDTYVDAIAAAEAEGYDVVVIDSLSHAWMGKDGALEQVDKAAKRSNSHNTFAAWRDVTPKHNRLVEALVGCRCHLVVTMRAKTEYVMEEVERGGRKTTTPRKVGLAPIQREGLEFEFDVVGDIDLEHRYVITKTRCVALDGEIIEKPGVKLGQTLLAWLQDGVAVPEKPRRSPSTPPPGNGRPAFSKQARWDFADEWNGRHLDEAPLSVLLAYEIAVKAARDNAAPDVLPQVEAVLTKVAAEIARKEPREPGESDPWNLSGHADPDHASVQ